MTFRDCGIIRAQSKAWKKCSKYFFLNPNFMALQECVYVCGEIF